MLLIILMALFGVVFWAGLSFGYEFGKKEAWEDGFIQGQEAGQLDTLDARPYVMEIKE